MPTSPLPRRVSARAGATAAVAALTIAGTALVGASAAFAAPGDNGDVKIHAVGTPFQSQRNEPKVCTFYLDAFNFDVVQGITWSIGTQPALPGGATLAGVVRLVSGTGHTVPLTLPDGQYKLTWKIIGGNGAGKHKVFKVDCSTATPPPTTRAGVIGGPGGGPYGGPPAGGGGLAHPQDFSPVAGAAAVGLVVVGGVVYLRLRRRPDGAA